MNALPSFTIFAFLLSYAQAYREDYYSAQNYIDGNSYTWLQDYSERITFCRDQFPYATIANALLNIERVILRFLHPFKYDGTGAPVVTCEIQIHGNTYQHHFTLSPENRILRLRRQYDYDYGEHYFSPIEDDVDSRYDYYNTPINMDYPYDNGYDY